MQTFSMDNRIGHLDHSNWTQLWWNYPSMHIHPYCQCNLTQNFRAIRCKTNWLDSLIFKTGGKMLYPIIKIFFHVFMIFTVFNVFIDFSQSLKFMKLFIKD